MAIKQSLRLAMLLLLSHAAVAAVVFVTQIPLAARMAVMLLILMSLLYYLARDALLLLPDSWHEISLDQGLVSLTTLDGSEFYGHAGSTAVNPYFVVLSVILDGRRQPVFLTIFPDALECDEFRELCVRLRFG